MKKKIIAAAVIAAFIAVPVAVKLSKNKTVKEAELAKVELRQIQPTILASGNLVFSQEVQLSSEVIGKVSEVLVKEGDKIEKGQVLLRLDPTTYRAEVAQQDANRRSAAIAIERAQLNLANQKRNLERNASLADARFIGASKYDDARHAAELAAVELRASREALQQAEAMLSLSKERLAKTEVRAPISGTATSVQIKVGETAVASATGIAGSSLMTIADVSGIMAEVSVDEADVAGVAAGQAARIYPSAYADKPVSGKVQSVSLTPKVSPQARNYIVKVRLDDTTLALRTGMTARVEIVLGGGTARPSVPLQAVMTEQAPGAKDNKQSSFVLAVVDGVVRKRTVELGLADDNNQEVLKGVARGDTVAIGPARLLRELRDGEAVAALKADPKKEVRSAQAPQPKASL
ncbi:efflux RND transporter periplasmic adaptor subunit [Massilia cavernae]|uniref:Efflux RND transporter periplasmic adaptor subunit n=1 Tax=Massilia cavernae TaxID=2320864 RepID=A0A418Y0Y6_9BURK|nr:efflux RND transporter periplasmic adaptor subunit [Massilia cavernae]RJG19099.1 efflux RND transporter periplasmic adaptor subunit [Massilia cavernae]